MAELAFNANAALANTSGAASQWWNFTTGAAATAVPTSGDLVFLGTRGNTATSITCAAASSGGTSVTLTFTGGAGALKKGAVIKIAGTLGMYVLRSDATSGSAVGVSPALRAAVTAGSAVTYANGADVVTFDSSGTTTWGDDTTGGYANSLGGGAVTITCPEFKFSRSVSHTLILRGCLYVMDGTFWNRGTDADPIPSGVNSVIEVGSSASQSAGKYPVVFGATNNGNAGLRWGEQSASLFSEVSGVPRTRATRLTASITAGATSAVVADATNWAVGDDILFTATSNTGSGTNTHTGVEIKTIATLTPGSGTTATITWTGGLVQDHSDQGWVHNRSSNVAWNCNTGASGRAAIAFRINGASTIRRVYAKHVRYANRGGNSIASNDDGAISVTVDGASNDTAGKVLVEDCAFPDCTNGIKQFQSRTGLILRRCVSAGPLGVASTLCGFLPYSGAIDYTVEDCHFAAGQATTTSFGTADCGGLYRRCIYTGGYTNAPYIVFGASGGSIYEDCFFGSCRAYITAQSNNGYLFRRCYFGVTHPTYGGGTGSAQSFTYSANGFFKHLHLFQDCVFNTAPTIENQTTNFTADFTNCALRFINYNNDSTQQRTMYRTGNIVRDNSTINRGRSSVSFFPLIANTAHGETYSLAGAQAGTTYTVKGFLRFDSTYGTGTPPTVSLSGLGGTTANFTAPATADAWHEFSLSITPTSTGSLTLTVSGKSASTTGDYWLDGVAIPPWTDWVWHYGSFYNPGSPFYVTDPNVVANFATASGYTGLAWSGGTLTISGTRTAQELYDWAAAYGVGNRLNQFVTGSPSNLNVLGNLTASTTFAGTISATGTTSGTLTTGGSYTYTGGTLSVSTDVPTFAGGTLNLGAAGSYVFSSTGTLVASLTPTAPGTYIVTGTHGGTLDLRNTSAHAITVQVPTGTTTTTANNTGGTITVTNPIIYNNVSITGFAANTRVIVFNETANTTLLDTKVASAPYTNTYVEGSDYTTGDTIRIYHVWVAADGTSATKKARATVTAGATGWSVNLEQETCTTYAAYYATYSVTGAAVDASGDFIRDMGNLQIDLDDDDNSWFAHRLFLWDKYDIWNTTGRRAVFTQVSATDAANLSIGTLLLDNVTNRTAKQADEINVVNSTSTLPVVNPTSGGGGITMFSGGKVLTTSTGGVAPSESQIKTWVREELSTEMNRIDVAVSTRASSTIDGLIEDVGGDRFTAKALEEAPAGGGGTADWTATERQHIRHRLGIDGSAAAPSATPSLALESSVQAVKAKTDNLPASPANETTVAARPTLAQIEASTVLAKESTVAAKASQASVTALGSPLQAGSYVAPDNVGIAAIDARLPADPADQSAVEAAIAAIPSAPSAAANASAVRSELATELARIDATVSSRNAVAPDNASVAAIKAKTDNLTADPADNSEILAAISAQSAPTAEQVADAVRTELATELARVDAPISSRATAGDVFAA
jgi:hypothetical protein